VTAPTCPACGHPLTCHRCQASKGGRTGGKATSKAKAAAARRNGLKGGRKRKIGPWTDASQAPTAG
jgi:hypothetical protein